MESILGFISANLKAKRVALGWSQERLAHEAQIDRTMLSRIEAQGANPSLATLLKLANALGTSVDSLLKTRKMPAKPGLAPGRKPATPR
jgi:transcriptional regulator with XRE-family HTH domain